MGDRDDRANVVEPSAPVDHVPVPAARYTVHEGAVVVTSRNGRFAESFAASDPRTTVRRWLAENGLSVEDGTPADVCSSLRAGEEIDVTVSAADGGPTYRVRSEPGPDAPAGTLTVTRGPARSEALAGEQIASIVSHDLRNPLDVAKAHLLAARESGDQEHFDTLERAHERMERIIADVLTLARGDGVVDPSQAVDLEAVVNDAWETVDTGSAELDCTDPLPTVEADPDRVQRLFENLFRNSIEHATTDADSPVSIAVGTTADGFFVTDDGPGIDPSERDRVFEPGYSSTDGGTGLGLTIVERIATAHGWHVTLTDGADGGARFEFTLPEV